MVAAQPLQARPELGGEFVLGRVGPPSLGNRCVEARGSEGEAAVDEVAESVGQVLVHTVDEALDRKVGIGILRRVGGEPPAPAVGGEQRQSRVLEYPALPTGREFAAREGEPVEALDDVRELERKTGAENRRGKAYGV